MIVVFFLEEVRVDVQLGVEVEAAQIEYILDRDFPKVHGFLWCTRVHLCQAGHQRSHLVACHQVRLADKNLVRKSHLATGFLAVVQLGHRVLGIDQCQDGVQQVLLGDFFVHEKSLRHRARIGQTGGFDDNAVKLKQALALFGGQKLQRFAQILAD